MANYVKSTNFASKDSLPSGDPLKIVKGTEIDTEFNNIATAVSSKAESNSPSLIGIPTAPTATYGTQSTQIATTAFVQAALEALHPIGSIYINTTSTNPFDLFGFGTWEAFGAGRVLVGQNASDSSFDVLEETGGSKDAIAVAHTHTWSGSANTSSVGDHNHYFSTSTSTEGNHQHAVDYPYDCTSYKAQYGTTGGTTDTFCDSNGPTSSVPLTASAGAHSHSLSGYTANGGGHYHSVSMSGTTSSTGSSGTNANLQPYVVVKMWKRTA